MISHLRHALQREKTGERERERERAAAGLGRDNKIKMKRAEDGGKEEGGLKKTNARS